MRGGGKKGSRAAKGLKTRGRPGTNATAPASPRRDNRLEHPDPAKKKGEGKGGEGRRRKGEKGEGEGNRRREGEKEKRRGQRRKEREKEEKEVRGGGAPQFKYHP